MHGPTLHSPGTVDEKSTDTEGSTNVVARFENACDAAFREESADAMSQPEVSQGNSQSK